MDHNHRDGADRGGHIHVELNPSPTMSRIASHVRARPRLLISIFVGFALALLLPGTLTVVTRSLIGWNVTVWLYLFLVAAMMRKSDHLQLRRIAVAQAEGTATVLTIVVLAALVSMAGIVVEMSAAKVPGAAHAWPHVAFALSTVVSGWLLLPVVFTMAYASLFFRTAHGAGLLFPSIKQDFKPNYSDFLYFAFTNAVASQTADVSVSTQPMRRLVLLQSILSFAFNTAILAFSINIAASMF